MKLLKYNKYSFLKKINESSEFADLQMGQATNPLGPGYGFAQDPTMSIYSDGSNPYVDNYAQTSRMVQDMINIMRKNQQFINNTLDDKIDYFVEEIDEYKNLKILRIFVNNSLRLDVFISFTFMEEEYFGVYRDFNGVNKTKLDSDLLTDPRVRHINKEYYIKLNNYFYKILYNWFIPSPGDYVVLSDDFRMKTSMGDIIEVKQNSTVYVKGYNVDENNDPFLIIKFKDENYTIGKNDYFFFKYKTKKLEKGE